MNDDYKVEWKQLPAKYRYGLEIARVQPALIENGELSSNEIEALARFGYICVFVALVAVFEVFCCMHFAFGANKWVSAVSAILWGGTVYSFDRSLFRDTIDKGRIRILLVVVATLVFSLGISVLLSNDQLEDIITQENNARIVSLDRSLTDNIKKYQDRLDAALLDQANLSTTIINGNISSSAATGERVAQLQAEASKYARDTTAEGKRQYRAILASISALTQTDGKNRVTANEMRQKAEDNVTVARAELELKRKQFEDSYKKQRTNPDYSATNKTMTLLRHYFTIGGLHFVIVILIGFIELFPLFQRHTYRDYDAVYLMCALGSVPAKQHKARLLTLRQELEQLKKEALEAEKQEKEQPEQQNGQTQKEQPFKDLF